MLKNLKLILWLILLCFLCISIGLGEEILPPNYKIEEASPSRPITPEREYVISPLKLTGPVMATPLKE